MLMLMRYGRGLPLYWFILCGCWQARAQSTHDSIQTQNISPSLSAFENKVQASVGFGAGSFQNIVVASGGPDEGQPAKSQVFTTEQRGVPVVLGLGYLAEQQIYRYAYGIQYLKMLTLMGRSDGQKSSPAFSRLETYVEGGREVGMPELAAYVKLIARRDSFKDGSFTHMLDAGILDLGMGYELARSEMRFDLYHSLGSRFATTSGGNLRGTAAAGSNATVRGAKLSWLVDFGRNSQLDLSLEREMASVAYQAHETYQSYGFNLTPTEPRQRQMNLTTDLLSIGLTRNF